VLLHVTVCVIEVFLLYRLYNQSTIDLISSHVENGESLPSSMMQQLYLDQKYMAGYELCRELYLASLDLELHTS
jgi:oligopeptidase A